MTSSEKKKSALGFGPKGAERMDFSGKERDKLFLSDGGKSFVDVSYLGGVDNPQDGRVMATADLDHDGLLEMLVAYRNAPLLRVYRASGIGKRGRVLGLLVTGGTGPGSNLDGIGTRVTARCGGLSHTRLVQVGTGFSTQNARALTIGVGGCEKVDELVVTWPDGRERIFRDKPTDELYRLSEDGPLQHVPGFYARAAAAAGRPPSPPAAARARTEGGLLAALEGALAHDATGVARPWKPDRTAVLVTFWASWCESCKKAQPRLDELAARYRGRIDFVGVTLDAKDDAGVVRDYARKHRPAYPLLSLPPEALTAVEAAVRPHFRESAPPLPSALLVEATTGKVLLRSVGAPAVSEVEAALD